MQEEIQGECKKIFVKPEGDCEGTEEIDRQHVSMPTKALSAPL